MCVCVRVRVCVCVCVQVGVPGQPMFAVGPMIAANKGYLGYGTQHAIQLVLQLGVTPGAAFLLSGSEGKAKGN